MAGEWRLSAVEFDVLWRELGLGAPPYPLDVPSPGTTYEERAEIVAEVNAELSARGMAEEDGVPRPELADALNLLAGSDVLIDGHLVLDDHIRVVAARAGDRAAMVLQLEERLIVRAFPGPRLATALAELLPSAPSAHGQSVSLPYVAWTDGLRMLSEGGSAWDFEQALKNAGVRGQDVRWIAGLARAGRSNGAQFGVTVRRGDGGEQRPGLVSWYATEDGGVVIHRQNGSDWVTIAPGDPSRLVARLEDMTRTGREPPKV